MGTIEAMAAPVLSCPHCSSNFVVKNGLRRNLSGVKQNYLCRNCGGQHREGDRRHALAPDKQDLIKRMQSERVSLRGIARALVVSLPTVMKYAGRAWEEEGAEIKKKK